MCLTKFNNVFFPILLILFLIFFGLVLGGII